MGLLTALAIWVGEYPELTARMKEAARTIKLEEIRSDSYLCQETVKALKKYKAKK